MLRPLFLLAFLLATPRLAAQGEPVEPLPQGVVAQVNGEDIASVLASWTG